MANLILIVAIWVTAFINFLQVPLLLGNLHFTIYFSVLFILLQLLLSLHMPFLYYTSPFY